MARAVRFRKENQSKFSNLFTGLCQRKSSWEVWADFVAMSACAISNAFDREGKTHDDREKQYIRTIKGYNEAERQVFPKLFALLVEALEDEPDQDFLGEMFMGLNLGNHWKGQFFTPYNVCRMMAEMQIDGIETRVERQGWVSVLDPCCGAGALLIAARNARASKGSFKDWLPREVYLLLLRSSFTWEGYTHPATPFDLAYRKIRAPRPPTRRHCCSCRCC